MLESARCAGWRLVYSVTRGFAFHMSHPSGKSLLIMALLLAAGFSAGCVNGPFYRMWYKKQWDEDEKYGPTFYTRMEELKKLQKRAKSMNAEEQLQVVQQLTPSLNQDPCNIYRAEVAWTLSSLSCPAAAEALTIAIKDQEPRVRTVACQAWGKRDDQQALQVLTEVVTSDTDLDVRCAAARELGHFKDQAAVRALGTALDDPDPSLQHRAVLSLRSVTGKDYGDSVPAWRQFVRGEQVRPNEGPTLVQRLRRIF